jgi:hypothetical protein
MTAERDAMVAERTRRMQGAASAPPAAPSGASGSAPGQTVVGNAIPSAAAPPSDGGMGALVAELRSKNPAQAAPSAVLPATPGATAPPPAMGTPPPPPPGAVPQSKPAMMPPGDPMGTPPAQGGETRWGASPIPQAPLGPMNGLTAPGAPEGAAPPQPEMNPSEQMRRQIDGAMTRHGWGRRGVPESPTAI